MHERDGDAPNLNIDAGLLGEKVPDVPKLHGRRYVAANSRTAPWTRTTVRIGLRGTRPAWPWP